MARLAERMFVLVIVLYVLDRFRSPALAGWAAFATTAPGLAISPLAGALLDRIGPVRGIAADMATSAVLLFALAAAGPINAVSVPLVMGVAALYSLTSPLSAAGIRSLMPRLVPESSFDRANALDIGSFALIEVLGPAAAGACFGIIGPDPTIAGIAALYLAASVSLGPLFGERRIRASGPSEPLMRQARAGLAYVVRHATLRGLAISYASYQAAWGVLLVVVPVFVARELGTSTMVNIAVGALWALSGLAGGCGALIAGHWGVIGRERAIIGLGTLATALAIYPLSAHLGLTGLAAGLALAGLLAGPIDVALLTLRQRRTEPQWLGRVVAISMSLNLSGLPLGSMLGGLAVTHSPILGLALAAAAAAFAALGAWRLVPALPR